MTGGHVAKYYQRYCVLDVVGHPMSDTGWRNICGSMVAKLDWWTAHRGYKRSPVVPGDDPDTITLVHPAHRGRVELRKTPPPARPGLLPPGWALTTGSDGVNDMTDEKQTEKKNHKLHPPALKVMHELHTSTVMWAALDGEPFKIVNRLLDYGLAQHRPDDRVVLTPDGITEALAAYAVRQRRHAENHADAMAALLKPPAATVIDGPQAGQLDDAALAMLVPVYRAGLDLGAAGPQVQAYCDRMEQKHASTVESLPEWLQSPVKARLMEGETCEAIAGDLDSAALKVTGQ